MWEMFPGFHEVPKQENAIMIGENDSDIRTKSSQWFIPEVDPSKGASQQFDSRALQKAQHCYYVASRFVKRVEG
jgi:hypothetical protein